MKNEFENDPVLGQLSKAARKPQAPKLGEGLLVAAATKDASVKAGKFRMPTLFVSLASATTAVLLVTLVANPSITNNEPYSQSKTGEDSLTKSGDNLSEGSYRSNPNLPEQATKLLEAEFGEFYAYENWSTQLNLEANLFFLVRNSQVFQVYRPIDSPAKFWEITSPKYLEEQGFNSTGYCNLVEHLYRPIFLVLASDGGLYDFYPKNLCDNGKLGSYLDELDEALSELGYKNTPMF